MQKMSNKNYIFNLLIYNQILYLKRYIKKNVKQNNKILKYNY